MIDSGSSNKISLDSQYKMQETTPILNIDHHDENQGYGQFNYVKHNYGSACMVLYELIKKWGYTLNESEKEFVLMTVLTDTGFFSHIGLTSAKTFRFVAKLIDEEEVDYQAVLQPLIINQPEDNALLKKIVFKNLVIDHNEKYAYSWATKEDVKSIGLNWKNVTVRHVDIIKEIETVDFAFFVTELEDHNYEVSFRSRDLNFSVFDIIKILGGGGYRVAGGAKLGQQKDIQSAIQYVKKAINDFRGN